MNSLTLWPKAAYIKGLRALCAFLLTFSITSELFSQDTINFRLYDSVKTSAEDNHKSITSGRDTDNSLDLIGAKRHNENNSYDLKLFRKINNSRSNLKDKLLNTFDRSMLPMTFLFPAAVFTYGRVAEKTYDENTGYLLGASVVTNTVITATLKYTIKRIRPRNKLNNIYTRPEFTDRYSFPSGHSSLSFAAAGMFALRYSKYPQVYVPMYAWALAIAYARPYFGMHYPSDLLAGAFIGTGSSLLIYSLRSELFKLKNNVLNETKHDAGSINGGTVSIFAGSFIISTLINEFIIRYDNRVRFNVLPQGQGMTLNLNWHY